jgi:hypothetical protein
LLNTIYTTISFISFAIGCFVDTTVIVFKCQFVISKIPLQIIFETFAEKKFFDLVVSSFFKGCVDISIFLAENGIESIQDFTKFFNFKLEHFATKVNKRSAYVLPILKLKICL